MQNEINKIRINWVSKINYSLMFLFLIFFLSKFIIPVVFLQDSFQMFSNVIFIGVGIFGFITLPLHIYDNFKALNLGNKILAWSILLTTLALFGAFFFDIKYSSHHHSGFSDGDVFFGFLSALFLINSYLFVISLIVRKKARLLIHAFDYLLGVMMFLTGVASTAFIIYLINKVG